MLTAETRGPATRKALMILEAFAGERVELSMSELARVGLPTSTVHRLIQDLVSWGGLERTARASTAWEFDYGRSPLALRGLLGYAGRP